jgi:hypothetical protein
MRRTIAVILIILVVAPTDAIAGKPNKPMDWQTLQTLPPGTQIVIWFAGDGVHKVRLLFADEKVLMTMKLGAPKLPGRVEKLLYRIGSGWPGLAEGAETFEDGRLRVSRDGIYDGDKKLADLADVVRRSSRTDVREITAPPGNTARNVKIGVAVAVAVGALVALFLYVMHHIEVPSPW